MSEQLRRKYWNALAQVRELKRRTQSRLRTIYSPLQQRNNRGVFAVDIDARVGLFAQLNWTLRVIRHSDQRGLRPHVALSSRFYSKPGQSNWFDTYFENLALTEQDRCDIASGAIRVSTVETIEELGLPGPSLTDFPIEEANRLFFRYIRPKADIVSHVDTFIRERLGEFPVLGVHYRGTDKSTEAPPVSQIDCLDKVQAFLDEFPKFRTVFVASDDQRFIDAAEKSLRGVTVVAHDDEKRSEDGRPIHSRPDPGDNSRKAFEALSNCLIMARCQTLIRTASIMSGWASVFNPDLPIMMLNRPFGQTLWFPDSQVVKRSVKAGTRTDDTHVER